ncbi:hypothetical protein SAY86_023290 [Trapa natans]|uniref:RING-type E3 ubiquitin transferase n=1 Tax=Trapa natans TaxID=22666 RepID=A0AAN7LUS7_TRANT|nr:hypothetical protein SAY86_023290 [Trapa natans]
MWMAGDGLEKRGKKGLVAVAIDKDKGSQYALKWAVDHLLTRGQTILLIHIRLRSSSASPAPRPDSAGDSGKEDPQIREVFLPFRCFCVRKDIQCKDIVLEDTDVAKTLTDYVSKNGIDHLVIGASPKSGFLRFKTDISTSVVKGAPDFCNVYAISKGKISTMRTATKQPPAMTPLRAQILSQSKCKGNQPEPQITSQTNSIQGAAKKTMESSDQETEFFRSPFTRGKGANGKPYGEIGLPDSDISFISSSGRPSIDQMFPSLCDSLDSAPRYSNMSDMDFDLASLPRRSMESFYTNEFSYASTSQESEKSGTLPSQSVDDTEAEMRRLRLELKQTMEMYSTACKEALSAQQKAKELQRWKIEEQRKIDEARQAEEAALAIAEKEKAKSRAAIEAADAARRIAELEAQKRIDAEKKALREAEEKKMVLDKLSRGGGGLRCRKYTIEEIEVATEYFAKSHKIGEGGYGPVYRCFLEHTPAAVKVLRPDAAQGRSQFLQEVEVLSCIRHPNMVLLLGVCPEFGCLVYEYMANGSLEDRLLCRGGTPPLSWQLRFKIAAEIGTGLLFLHQTKPEPLVHRDLKPANILLDSNFVSKISDVGLARLVPPSVSDTVTQYRMTSTAGTFCYIDPEYQQTGMLGVKSDIYSLGIIFLQILTARPAMGLTHHVEHAIEEGTFVKMLDPAVPDWPVDHALAFAKLALQCAELRRKDRPDLAKVILPELNKLRSIGEDANPTLLSYVGPYNFHSQSKSLSQVSLQLGSRSPPTGRSMESLSTAD